MILKKKRKTVLNAVGEWDFISHPHQPFHAIQLITTTENNYNSVAANQGIKLTN